MIGTPLQCVTGDYPCSVPYGLSWSRQPHSFARTSHTARGGMMARRTGKRPIPEEARLPFPGLLRQDYPTIADWASGFGWVEFGIDGRDRPFVRALDEGGTVWEGEERYESLDEALRAMEAGLGEFM